MTRNYDPRKEYAIPQSQVVDVSKDSIQDYSKPEWEKLRDVLKAFREKDLGLLEDIRDLCGVPLKIVGGRPTGAATTTHYFIMYLYEINFTKQVKEGSSTNPRINSATLKILEEKVEQDVERWNALLKLNAASPTMEEVRESNIQAEISKADAIYNNLPEGDSLVMGFTKEGLESISTETNSDTVDQGTITIELLETPSDVEEVEEVNAPVFNATWEDKVLKVYPKEEESSDDTFLNKVFKDVESEEPKIAISALAVLAGYQRAQLSTVEKTIESLTSELAKVRADFKYQLEVLHKLRPVSAEPLKEKPLSVVPLDEQDVTDIENGVMPADQVIVEAPKRRKAEELVGVKPDAEPLDFLKSEVASKYRIWDAKDIPDTNDIKTLQVWKDVYRVAFLNCNNSSTHGTPILVDKYIPAAVIDSGLVYALQKTFYNMVIKKDKDGNLIYPEMNKIYNDILKVVGPGLQKAQGIMLPIKILESKNLEAINFLITALLNYTNKEYNQFRIGPNSWQDRPATYVGRYFPDVYKEK